MGEEIAGVPSNNPAVPLDQWISWDIVVPVLDTAWFVDTELGSLNFSSERIDSRAENRA